MIENAWKDPTIPASQWQVAGPELENARRGIWPEGHPFTVIKSVFGTAAKYVAHAPKVLDIGAASCYYKEVLELAGFKFDYTGCDYSEAFKDFAKTKYPDAKFQVADADSLPFEDASFDIVLHGACIMHVRDWKKSIDEAYRVAGKFVIWHRTPILWNEPTKTFKKLAYDVECEETHFNYDSLERYIESAGGVIISLTPIFEELNPDGTKRYGHYTILTAIDPEFRP